MNVALFADQAERWSQQAVQAGPIMALNRLAKAFFRPIRRECGDDGMAIGGQRAGQRGGVIGLILWRGQEMQRRTVMAQRIAALRLPVAHIRNQRFGQRPIG